LHSRSLLKTPLSSYKGKVDCLSMSSLNKDDQATMYNMDKIYIEATNFRK